MRDKKRIIVSKESLTLMLELANPEKKKHIVGRALAAIFSRQTEDEQKINITREVNGKW